MQRLIFFIPYINYYRTGATKHQTYLPVRHIVYYLLSIQLFSAMLEMCSLCCFPACFLVLYCVSALQPCCHSFCTTPRRTIFPMRCLTCNSRFLARILAARTPVVWHHLCYVALQCPWHWPNYHSWGHYLSTSSHNDHCTGLHGTTACYSTGTPQLRDAFKYLNAKTPPTVHCTPMLLLPVYLLVFSPTTGHLLPSRYAGIVLAPAYQYYRAEKKNVTTWCLILLDLHHFAYLHDTNLACNHHNKHHCQHLALSMQKQPA